MGFIERVEKTKGLRLRGELNPLKLLEERGKVMRSACFTATLKNMQKVANSCCEDWIALNKLEAVYCMHKRHQHLMYE